ncbi:hypothetical protein [Kocuria sp. CNJ-770]|uniref:hypothetical protein n=1 Tax=Kocuria sp. CNJ-770 TaxID=1904964 RepID=UPI0011150CDE|nr:hypothetical protein [Kocuria sp. CNJ-770]
MSAPTRLTVARDAGGRAGRWRPAGGGRGWAVVWMLAVVWSLGGWLAADGPVVNTSGWSRFAEFFAAALSPQLSTDFLLRTGSAALSTLSYAVLGTLLAVVVGLVVGVLVSETWWAAGTGARSRRGVSRVGWLLTRLALAVPRGRLGAAAAERAGTGSTGGGAGDRHPVRGHHGQGLRGDHRRVGR